MTMICVMVGGSSTGLTAASMKGIGKMTRRLVKGDSCMAMGTCMWATGLKTRRRAMENTYIRMDQSFRETGN
jgi:hypothetical protein